MTQIHDLEILEKFAQDATKSEAFNLLLKKYQQKIYWHIRRMVLNHEDCDDILQEVFIKVWKNLANFRQDAKLYTWLYRIATNESISFLNKKRQQQLSTFEEGDNFLAENLQAAHYFDGNALQQKLQRAILTLPEKQRLIFNMKYFDDLKYEEISEILGTTVGGLKASYHIAAKKIQDFIINED